MTDRQKWVANRLYGILYESWTPEQVNTIAQLACEAVDQYNRDRWLKAASTIATRRDHTVEQAWAYRDGIEDTIAMWEETWDDPPCD